MLIISASLLKNVGLENLYNDYVINSVKQIKNRKTNTRSVKEKLTRKSLIFEWTLRI